MIENALNSTTQGAPGMMLQKLKVYELAKELGMDSIALLEKLKQLDIDVKSHMSSLGSEEVRNVREQLVKEQALLSKATKTIKTTKRKEEEPIVQKRTSPTTVIRRRAKAPESLPETVAPQTEPTETPPAPQEIELQNPSQSQTVSVSEPATSQPEFTAQTSTPSPTAEKPALQPKVIGSGLKMPTLLGARNQGLTSTRTGSILKIVQEESQKKPSIPQKLITPIKKELVPPKTGTAILKKGGYGIVNLGKEAIEKMLEEELQYRKKGTAGRGERDRELKDIKVSDYRAKKEFIFLPKKKKVPTNKEIKKTELTTPAAHKRIVRIEDSTSVSELAQRMGIKATELIKKLMGMGVMATLNHTIDTDTATLLATEYNYEVENVAFKEETLLTQVEDKPEDLVARPPIVTVMGHVDHGKTSLLDAIRSTQVTADEPGGITQHIGAYTVEIHGKKITFIDTPGHEAFTALRARGAHVTDLVVLVVAADDGVMPQTREAIDHAKAANVPLIVAINKIDKAGSNPERAMKGLSELNLVPEAWGGDNIFVNVSALKKTGLQELLESILLQAEILDLKANPKRPAEGSVLETRLDRSRGPIVNVLIKRGTLNLGDSVVAGCCYGRVRALTNDQGQSLKSIGPGFAAELLGLEVVPAAGDSFCTLPSEIAARTLAEYRAQKIKGSAETTKTPKMGLDELFAKIQQGDIKELPIIVKADVFGSVEAIQDSLTKISTDKAKIKILSASTGGINESDVLLASASHAIIIGFNVRPETKARALAETEKIEIKTYTIIYELIDEVRKALTGILDKKEIEKYMGRAEVRETFNVPKIGTVAGCAVIDGKITRSCQVRLLRDSRVIFTGRLASLRRFKDDAKEVTQGYECGMGIENYNDIKQGDQIEAFIMETIAPDLGTSSAQQ